MKRKFFDDDANAKKRRKKPISIKVYFSEAIVQLFRWWTSDENLQRRRHDYLCWNESCTQTFVEHSEKLIYRQQWQKVNILRAKLISCKFILCSLSLLFFSSSKEAEPEGRRKIYFAILTVCGRSNVKVGKINKFWQFSTIFLSSTFKQIQKLRKNHIDFPSCIFTTLYMPFAIVTQQKLNSWFMLFAESSLNFFCIIWK